jgi:hypothetical protein
MHGQGSDFLCLYVKMFLLETVVFIRDSFYFLEYFLLPIGFPSRSGSALLLYMLFIKIF